jgi:hypothetical protein
MRRRSFITAAAAAVFAGPVRAAATPPVVLELFTSEGCSSCPPADALLGDLSRRPGVIALAWHIDYWDGLGWRDPYASRTATNRQRAYAAQLHDEVYTPALVVNGAAMVVGSDAHAIAAAMASVPPAGLPVTLRRDATGVSAEIGGVATPLSAVMVAYDPMRVTAVGAGENGGRRLTEYNVVREATPLGIETAASGAIRLPAADPGRGIVLLLQSADLRVRGLAHLPPANVPARLL